MNATAASDDAPSSAELRAAYQFSRLWNVGMSYQKAIDTPLILKGLTITALARRHKLQGPRQARLTF